MHESQIAQLNRIENQLRDIKRMEEFRAVLSLIAVGIPGENLIRRSAGPTSHIVP